MQKKSQNKIQSINVIQCVVFMRGGYGAVWHLVFGGSKSLCTLL